MDSRKRIDKQRAIADVNERVGYCLGTWRFLPGFASLGEPLIEYL